MGKIAIVTDSAANLPEELIKEYGITVVPIYLHWNGEDYRDGIDITPSELYKRLREGKTLPKTSAPSVGDFLHTYLRLAEEADVILSIHLSPSLSAVYETARTAAEMVDTAEIYVVNSQTAAAAQGFVVLEAARAAQRGASVEEIMQRIEYVRSRVQLFAALSTLKYLYFGGRIGLAATLLGSALQLTPILYLRDGVADVWSKPRTWKKAFRELLRIAEQKIDGKRAHVMVMHADVPGDAVRLYNEMKERFDCAEIYITEFTPVMGAHTGPGLLGFVFWCED
ncbi:MAG: DegV family protein [Chloroflexi bacterium]|nr:MAG: DegV family protein [Chloroflexota bacterium]